MIDFTKHITLDPKWQKIYSRLRLVLFLVFLLSGTYFVFLTLFPPKNFNFFFRTPQAAKNTVINPRSDGDKMLFDTAVAPQEGNFSNITIRFILEKKSPLPKKGSSVSVRKSFQAFFYPEAGAISEPYSQNPDLPFPDGSLLSNGQSIFIVSGEKIYPIDSPETFQSMGFDWQDAQNATSEEISAYEKQKLFTIMSPHPDGTIFAEKSGKKYYLVKEGRKWLLDNQETVKSYLHKNPVIAEEKSLTAKSQCFLEKDFNFFSTSYSCQIPIETLSDIIGNDYQYLADIGPNVRIKELEIVFHRKINQENVKLALFNIKKNIIANFYGQPR